jgi:hypothetical protein
MKPPSIHRQTWLLSLPMVALIGLCLIWALAGQSKASAGLAFDSPLRPPYTPNPIRTPGAEASPTPAPTLGAFVSPLSTPIPLVVPFIRPYYGPPTPGPYVPSATATPRPAVPRAPGSRLVFLPAVMNNFPTYLTYGPKGIGDAWQNWQPGRSGTNMQALDYQWYYDWTFNYLPQRGQDPRYVRMIWCNETTGIDINGVTHSITDMARADYNAGLSGRVWLIYNEPDDPIQCTAFLGDAPAAARHFEMVYDMIKAGDPSAHVFAGGLLWLKTAETQTWWSNFITTLKNDGALYKLEGVHIHLYPYFSTSDQRQSPGGCLNVNCAAKLAQVANDWYMQQHVGLGIGDRPIWITEMGWLWDPTTRTNCYNMSKDWIRDNFMRPMSQWFARDPAWPYVAQAGLNPGYDGVAWYVTWDDPFPCTHLLNNLGANSTPTSLGTFWNGFQP